MIRRDCKTCKAGKDQSWNSCGYIPREKRRGNLIDGILVLHQIDFPPLKNPDFTISKCPVWYYNVYEHLYKVYNRIKDSYLSLSELPFQKRIIYDTFKTYIALKENYELEKARKKRGKNGR